MTAADLARACATNNRPNRSGGRLLLCVSLAMAAGGCHDPSVPPPDIVPTAADALPSGQAARPMGRVGSASVIPPAPKSVRGVPEYRDDPARAALVPFRPKQGLSDGFGALPDGSRTLSDGSATSVPACGAPDRTWADYEWRWPTTMEPRWRRYYLACSVYWLPFCMGGPGQEARCDCVKRFDADGDGDVDLRDAAAVEALACGRS